MKSNNDLKANTSKSGVRGVAVVKDNLAQSAMVSKLVTSNQDEMRSGGRSVKQSIMSTGGFDETSRKMRRSTSDNENILKLFPDIEIARQILVSSILSPKDMVKSELLYSMDDSGLPPKVISSIIDMIRVLMNKKYGLDNKLSKILDTALFEAGADVLVVLPENILDEVINSNISTESLSVIDMISEEDFAPVGILGPSILPKKESGKSNLSFALERLKNKTRSQTDCSIYYKGEKFLEGIVEVSDNLNFLRQRKLSEFSNKARVRAMSPRRPSMESYSMSNREFTEAVFKQQRQRTDFFDAIPAKITAKRKPVGEGLVMAAPSSAFIPVFTPGEPEDHIGYFAVLDEDGTFINFDYDDDLDLSNRMYSSNEMSEGIPRSLLEKSTGNLVGHEKKGMHFYEMSRLYGKLIEEDLVAKLKNGSYGRRLEIKENERINQIMLARAMANKMTRLLYIPVEYVSYIAFKYNKNGTGRSMLDDIKIISSIRAILLFADIMASVKSSIDLTTVNLTLDEDDEDPATTISMAMEEVIKTRQNTFPLGIHDPSELTNWIHRAGINMTFQGHPGLPETKLEFDVKNIQHTKPDSDLDEKLEKRMYMGLSLSPENVMNGQNAQFATTIVHDNLLLSKRVSDTQNRFMPMIKRRIEMILRNDLEFIKKVVEIVNQNEAAYIDALNDEEKEYYKERKSDEGHTEELVEFLIDKTLESLTCSLPNPDEATLTTQSAAFDEWSESVDKMIEFAISSGIFPEETVGNISQKFDNYKTAIKAKMARDWAAKNNYLPEINAIMEPAEGDVEGADLFEALTEYNQNVMQNVLRHIRSMKSIAAAADKDLENLGSDSSDSSSSDTSSDDTSSDSEDTSADESTDTPSDDSSGPGQAEDTPGDIADNMLDGGSMNKNLFG